MSPGGPPMDDSALPRDAPGRGAPAGMAGGAAGPEAEINTVTGTETRAEAGTEARAEAGTEARAEAGTELQHARKTRRRMRQAEDLPEPPPTPPWAGSSCAP